jgi:hypothetical protein
MKRFIQKRSDWSLKIAALVASTLLASVLPTLVQTAQASTPTNGTTEVINIGAGQTVQRSFNATQGNLIVYGLGNTVIASDYLKYRIYDSTGKGVGECQYTCPLYQHKTVARSFFPPSTGTYFMVLNFNNPKTTGAVKISILDAIQNPPQVLSGMTVENFQSSDVAKIFRITATQGNLIVYGLGNAVDANDYLQYRIYDSTGQAVGDCQYTCPLYQNKTVARSFSPPSTGTYFLVLNFNNPKTTGAVKLSFPESSEASIVPSASASPVTPTPKGTSASTSPTPSKTTSTKPTATTKPVVKNPATKIPFKVELRSAKVVETSSGDQSESANISGFTESINLNYHGNLNDKTTKPTGVRFYIKDPKNNVRTLIGAVALTTTKDVTGDEKPTCSLAKGKSVTYDCQVSFNPEKNGVAPKSKIFLYAAPYNSAGESSTLHPISLFPIMDKKAFIACLENGIDETKKELTAIFVGIALDTGASATTDSLKIGSQVWEQGTEATISLRLKQMASPTEDLKNLKDVASGTSMSILNKWLLGNAEIKISAKLIAKGATLSATAIGGVISAVDIIVAGQKAQYRISDCDTNNPY